MATTADEVIIQQTNQYPRKEWIDRRYVSQSYYFASPRPSFHPLLHVPFIVGQSTEAYWTLNRRKNREYLYQHVFPYAVKHALKTVPWTMTFSLYAANSYLNMKRVKEARKVYSTYPSFFMNIKTIPTYKWSCTSVDTTDDWTCE